MGGRDFSDRRRRRKAIKWRKITSWKWFFGMELLSMEINKKTNFFPTVM